MQSIRQAITALLQTKATPASTSSDLAQPVELDSREQALVSGGLAPKGSWVITPTANDAPKGSW